MRLGRAVERHGLGDDRPDRAVGEQVASGSIQGLSVPRSCHRRSMLSPITALESDICLIRSKPRTIRSACGARLDTLRFWPCGTLEAPNAISRPPVRSSGRSA